MKRESRGTLGLALRAFGVVIASSCGGRKDSAGGGDGGNASGSISNASGATASGSISNASGAITGASSSDMSSAGMSSSGMSGTMVSSDGGPVILTGLRGSTGCGKPWLGLKGQWVSQPTGCDQGVNNQGTAACQVIPQGGTVQAKATHGSPEYRGWWVYVPESYDPQKPYRVIYNGAGCGEGNWFSAGKDGLPYQNVDDENAILVGLDYDTHSDVPGCYDDRNAQSNDFTFFPWLQAQIENELCVDENLEFYSGYSSGAWVGQQFDCAFPDKLRGVVSITGCEPGAPGYPGSQFSPCVNSPTAAFFVKDFGDTDNTYACILPACTRVLKQNGCSTQVCNPLDNTTTTPYRLPAGVTPPANTRCVQFDGCPADYPVVFCLTYDQRHNDASSWGVPLFWDFMTRFND